MTLENTPLLFLSILCFILFIGVFTLAVKLSSSKNAEENLLSEKDDLKTQINRHHKELQRLRLKAARKEFPSNPEVLFMGCDITNGIITIPAGYLSDVEEKEIMGAYKNQPDGSSLLATNNLQKFLSELKHKTPSSGAGRMV